MPSARRTQYKGMVCSAFLFMHYYIVKWLSSQTKRGFGRSFYLTSPCISFIMKLYLAEVAVFRVPCRSGWRSIHRKRQREGEHRRKRAACAADCLGARSTSAQLSPGWFHPVGRCSRAGTKPCFPQKGVLSREGFLASEALVFETGAFFAAFLRGES